MAKINIIGSGFSSLSAATHLADLGHEVHVFEKNETLGGRARQFATEQGYVFDMGPSWYWMPDVFENYFKKFGYEIEDLFDLKLLDPSFNIVLPKDEAMAIPSNYTALKQLFESIEKGSSAQLDRFMKEAEYKYETGMNNLVHKPGLSILEFADKKVISGVFKLQVFTSFSKHVRRYFTNPKLIALMEFPVLFLGAMPRETPALYSLMNYAGLKLGTWYPIGGFGKVIDAMVKIAEEKGVKFHTSSSVEKIIIENKKCIGIQIDGKINPCDAVIAGADYAHVECQLLEPQCRNYSETYWKKKTFAPSCLIFYLGINKKLSALRHHTLFFDEDLNQHAEEIYKQPKWPSKPLFYVCAPSVTDDSVAPKGHENLFLLMPLAVGLEDNEALRENYFEIMLTRLEKHCAETIKNHIDYKKSYCVNDFVLDYNSYKGNAYGLANTLKQTANLKPKIKNKTIKNLFYTGQLTVPGPGVPPSLISGSISAKLLNSYLTKYN